MREILFRGKRVDNGEWVYGYYVRYGFTGREKDYIVPSHASALYAVEVIPETVGQYTGLTDKNGTKIFEGDIVQYISDDFDCQSVVLFGEYLQDGSGGEYLPTKCYAFYVEVDNYTAPDYYDNLCLPDYLKYENLKQVDNNCVIIGNIHDNPELLR